MQGNRLCIWNPAKHLTENIREHLSGFGGHLFQVRQQNSDNPNER